MRCRRDRRTFRPLRNGHCLLDMELSGLSLRVPSAVVEDPVGDVGALLDLRDEDACADRVQCPRRNEEDISLVYRNRLEDLRQRIVADPFLNSSSVTFRENP